MNVRRRMNKRFDITERTLKFGVRFILMSSALPRTPAGFAVAHQIVRSGTSVGANTEEAQDAVSKKEFIRIMTIALKECRETIYWLRIIIETKLISEKKLNALLEEAREIRAILATIIKKTKQNI